METTVKLLTVTLALALATVACNNSTAPKEEPPEITKEQVINTTANFLKDQGLAPESDSSKDIASENIVTTIIDYIDYEQKGENAEITLYIGPDGHLIPDPEWQTENKDACKSEYRYLKNSVQWLTIEIFPRNRSVQINIIDVETAVILKSYWADGNGKSWLYDAIKKAWNKFEQEPVKRAAEPCGKRINLKMKFNSTLELNPSLHDMYNLLLDVKADITLTFNKKDNFYYGTGWLKWEKLEVTGIGRACEAGTLQKEKIEISAFTLPGMKKGSKQIEMTLTVPYEDAFSHIWCTDPHYDDEPPGRYFVNYKFWFRRAHQDEYTENWDYLITGWDEVGDYKGVIAQKVYDRTKTENVGTIVEKTSIEIIHNHPEANNTTKLKN